MKSPMMNRRTTAAFTLLASVLALSALPVQAQEADSPNELPVAVGKSALVSSSQPIERISVGFGDIAEASAVSPTEVLVHGKAPGSTSLIIWQRGGGKLFFDVNVQPNRYLADSRLDAVRREIRRELPNQQITLSAEGESVFLRGTAKDLTSVDRAASIAATIGKVVNLLYVQVPARTPQILLKVRFASIDRNASTELGLNLFSTGATNTLGSVSTQQYGAPGLSPTTQPNGTASPFVFSDLLNIFLYRKDLNLGATIRALEAKGLLQILAQPNVLTEDGKQGSFLAGGEFPFPVLQGGGTAGGSSSVTIQFREFGVRLNVIPTISPSGTIKLQVAPEVSSLDFANALTISGFNIPALITRKVKTEVELEEGESFAIGGLLDKRVTESFEKVPFIGDVPVLGKLFQSKKTNRQNTELVVIVTPELVRPAPASAPITQLPYPATFMDSSPENAVRTPAIPASETAAPASAKTVPVEKLIESMRRQEPLDLSGGLGGKQSGSGAQGQSGQGQSGQSQSGQGQTSPIK